MQIEQGNGNRKSIIKTESQVGRRSNKIYLSVNLDYEVYREVKEFSIENHYDMSTVIENFLIKWVEMKKAGMTDKKIIKDYVIKGKGAVLNKKKFNPEGTAVHQKKTQFNLTLDNQLLYNIKSDSKMRELNISSMCNKFLWDIFNELQKENKDKTTD